MTNKAGSLIRNVLPERPPLESLNDFLNRGRGQATQFDMITYFKTHHPAIPLRVLKEASSSRRIVGDGGLSDAEFDALLAPWLA